VIMALTSNSSGIPVTLPSIARGAGAVVAAAEPSAQGDRPSRFRSFSARS
jgi:hypothetical protein